MAAVRVEITPPGNPLRYAMYFDAETGAPVAAVEYEQPRWVQSPNDTVRVSVLGVHDGEPVTCPGMYVGRLVLEQALRQVGYDRII